MGMYTELHFNVELKRDVPEDVLAVLRYMARATDGELVEPSPLPDHPLFKTDRWDYMLWCNSAYFPMEANSVLVEDEYARRLCVRSNLKNYGGEVEKFLTWVMPYVAAGSECLGYYRYEEDDDPTLIYAREHLGGEA